MSVVSAINILLRANTKELDKALITVEHKIHGFAEHVGGLGEKLGGLFAFAFDRIKSFSLEKAFEEIEHLGHVSERLDILPQQLAGMQMAAQMAGVEFDSLTTSLTKMLVAVSGSGDPLKKAAADASFKKLGINAQYLKSLHPEEQLSAIADALLRVENVADRVEIAKTIFGKGGVTMLNVLSEGSEGLAKWQRAAEEAGMALTKLDVHQVKEADEAVKRMWATFKGITLQIVVKLSPAIKVVTTLVRFLGSLALDVWNRWGGVITTVIQIMVAYRAVMWTIIAAQRAWTIAVAIWTAVSTGGWGAVMKVVTGIAAATGAVVLLNKAFDELEKKYKDMGDIKLPGLGDKGAFNIADGVGGNTLKMALAAHPAAYQRGSVDAYSASLRGGSTIIAEVAKHTKKSAKSLDNIDKKTVPAKARVPAKLGGK